MTLTASRPPTTPVRRTAMTRLVDHLREPMHRNAYALVAGSILTSMLGLLFWVVAARWYPTTEIGVAAAVISAMSFLANVATLGLRNGLVRFLPAAGGRSPVLVAAAYLVCALAAALAASVFLVGQPWWAPSLTLLREGPVTVVAFVACTAVWVLFVIEDHVLTGLRRATWVPVANLGYSAAKLLALVALVGMPAWGIVAAWTAPAAVVVVAVAALLVRRLLPAAVAEAGSPGALPVRQLVRFAALDHTSAVLWLATTELLPLVVLELAGASASAYYFLAFTVGYTLYLVVSNVGSAFVAEAASHPDDVDRLLRRAAVNAARLVLPAVVVGVALAPWVLGLLGKGYAAEGSTLLRLLLLSAVPQVVVGLSVSLARLRRQVGLVVLVYAWLALAVLGGSIAALRVWGLVGVGWAWLLAQSLLAVALLLTWLRPLWEPAAWRAVDVVAGWRRRLADMRRQAAADELLPEVAAACGYAVLGRGHADRAGGRTRGDDADGRARGDDADGRTRGDGAGSRGPGPDGHVLGPDSDARGHVLGSDSDALVVRTRWGGAPVVAKIAGTPAGAAALDRHADALARLHAMDVLGRWRELLPVVMHRGTLGERAFLVETCVGADPRPFRVSHRHAATAMSSVVPSSSGAATHSPATRDMPASLAAVAAAARTLHEATERRTVVDDRLLRRWVDEPFAKLAESRPGRAADIERLRTWLRAQLAEAPVTVSTVHGDLWLGNVVLDEPRVAGIVDWEDSEDEGIPDVDLAHLWLSAQPGGVGLAASDVLVPSDLLAASDVPTASDVLDGGTEPGPLPGWFRGRPNPQLDLRAVVLLAWAQHVARTLRRATDPTPSRVWFARTVDPVLDRSERVAGADDAQAVSGALSWTDRMARATARARRGGLALARFVAAHRVALTLTLVVGLWVSGLPSADPRRMTDLGMISLLTPAMAAALVLLLLSAVAALRRPAREAVLAAHVVLFVVMIHATPAIVFGTPRYSWSWKHIGIVDYILRHGGVDTTLESLGIYHNWPGMFAGSGLLTDLMGAHNAIALALWAPVAFNLLDLLALRFLLRSLTSDVRTVWLAIVLFFVTNWVGQDYFSPQAACYFLYLVLIGLVLRGLRARGPRTLAPPSELSRTVALALVVVLVLAIASSHQITPLITVLALAGLVLTRQVRGWYLPVLALGIAVGWAFLVARGYTVENLRDQIAALGEPVKNAQDTLAAGDALSGEQVLVSRGGRAVVMLIGLLAGVGTVRAWRGRRLDLAPVVLAAAPLGLIGLTDFGGEVLFRAFLFAVPFLAYLGALALLPSPDGARRPISWLRGVAVGVAVLVLLPGFLLGYYGKDRMNYFTPEEVQAATWLYSEAPPDSLIVEGTRNYPSMFLNYERFTFVPIAREPADSRDRLLAHPVPVLASWLSQMRYESSYLILTRSQKAESDLLGEMPRGALDRVEKALRASPRFRVAYENRDAVVFTLAPRSS